MEMRRVVEYRANRILFTFIKCNGICGTAIVPANVCQSVVDTLVFSGMTLCFVDISRETLCADDKSVMDIVRDASLFLFVHTYGIEMDSPEWFSDIRRLNPDIAIVDDRCLCIPQMSINETQADLVLYSFCPKKQIDLGIGSVGYLSEKWDYYGLLIKENPILTNESWTPDKRIRRVLNHKARLNGIYKESLLPRIQLKPQFQNWRFNIMVHNKKMILDKLFEEGLFASSHYRSKSLLCPIAISLHENVINLFNDFYYTEEQAIRTCEIVNSLIFD